MHPPMVKPLLFASNLSGGLSGDILLNEDADRISDYALFDLRDDGSFASIASTRSMLLDESRRRRRRHAAVTRVSTFDPYGCNKVKPKSQAKFVHQKMPAILAHVS